MAYTERFTIAAPADPEVNIKVRDTLEYYMVFPTGYKKEEKYGMAFCISGYGETANSEYYIDKLCPYISDTYNIITVGVRYHNDERVTPSYTVNIVDICKFYGVSEDYFSNSNVGNVIDRIFDLLVERRVPMLERTYCLLADQYHKYSSFGLMPAIDHLVVLSNILRDYNIDKDNIIAFGTSYGGYVASLMAKYAPQTFSLVIDNSGFCLTHLQEVLGAHIGGMSGAIVHYVDGVRYQIPYTSNSIWSLDETSSFYFSDAHKQIRNLIVEEHRSKSDTLHCCYHSTHDNLVPIALKDKMYNTLSKFNPTFYKRVEHRDIDGELFKSTEHGMDASLRKMFDYSMKVYETNKHKRSGVTDFDLSSTNSFICMDRQYNFMFSDKGFNVNIAKLKRDAHHSIDMQQSIAENEVNPISSDENNVSSHQEVMQQIMDLMPVLDEGLGYLQQNSKDGNLQDGVSVVEDFVYCLTGIEDAVQQLTEVLPDNQIAAKVKSLKDSLVMLFYIYQKNYRENAIEMMNSNVMSFFGELKEEINSVFRPITGKK